MTRTQTTPYCVAPRCGSPSGAASDGPGRRPGAAALHTQQWAGVAVKRSWPLRGFRDRQVPRSISMVIGMDAEGCTRKVVHTAAEATLQGAAAVTSSCSCKSAPHRYSSMPAAGHVMTQ